MIKKIILFVVLFATTGCASSPFGNVASGGASYTYQHVKGDESCSVQVTSARDVAGGVLDIGKDCTVKTSASTAGGASEAMGIIKALIGRLP